MPEDDGLSYDEHMQSEEWQRIRERRLEFAGRRCELCNRESRLQVHHRSYENFGDETMGDLIVLCKTCHDTFEHRLALQSPPPPEDSPAFESSPLEGEVEEAVGELEEVHDRSLTGIPSGFLDLDELTGGWQDSSLIVLAARPSMGTTSFALASALNAALHPESPIPVAFFSTETGGEQLAQRIITSEARVDSKKAHTGNLSNEDWKRIARAAGTISETPITVGTAPNYTTAELREEAHGLRRRGGADLVIIDSIDHLKIAGWGNTYRQYERAEVVRDLKELAMEMDVPVIVTSRLRRDVESRGGDKRPMLIDLPSDDGALEKDADVVSFIHRPERYGITVDENGNSTEGIAEIIVGKQRNGPVGTVELAFVKQYGRFENLTSSEGGNDDFSAPRPSGNAPL